MKKSEVLVMPLVLNRSMIVIAAATILSIAAEL